MPDQEENLKSCDECGATIYPEHLVKGMAEQWEGKLLCVHCLKDKRSAPQAAPDAAIMLEDEEPPPDYMAEDEGLTYQKKPTAIRSFGGGPGGMAAGLFAADDKLRRPLLKGSPNATRARTFHCKLADAAFTYLCEQINEWADSRDDVEIKFATTCIGVVEGKHADSHLIVTVFY